MLTKLRIWLKTRFSAGKRVAATDLHMTGAHATPSRVPSRRQAPHPNVELVDDDKALADENSKADKNTLIRNKFVREDTGTHETLKILDDSMIDSGEATGIDPYNTGGFDRSKNWDRRFNK